MKRIALAIFAISLTGCSVSPSTLTLSGISLSIQAGLAFFQQNPTVKAVEADALQWVSQAATALGSGQTGGTLALTLSGDFTADLLADLPAGTPTWLKAVIATISAFIQASEPQGAMLAQVRSAAVPVTIKPKMADRRALKSISKTALRVRESLK